MNQQSGVSHCARCGVGRFADDLNDLGLCAGCAPRTSTPPPIPDRMHLDFVERAPDRAQLDFEHHPSAYDLERISRIQDPGARADEIAALLAVPYENPPACAHTFKFLVRGSDFFCTTYNAAGTGHCSFRAKGDRAFGQVIYSMLATLRNSWPFRKRFEMAKVLLGRQKAPTL